MQKLAYSLPTYNNIEKKLSYTNLDLFEHNFSIFLIWKFD